MSSIKIVNARDLHDSFFSARRLAGGLEEVSVILEAG